jgi:HEAT repeat protein
MPAFRSVAAAVALAAAASHPAADAQSGRALRALRDDGSRKVRAQAAAVLGRMGDAEAVPALCRALSEDEAPAVRVAAAAALQELGDPGGVATLRAAASGDPDRRVREVAGLALGAVQRGARAVVLEEAQGDAGGARVRALLRAGLAAQLGRRGFALVDTAASAAYRLKPAVLQVDLSHTGGGTQVEVKVSLIAVGRGGRIAAMVEGGARASTSAASGANAQLESQAVAAAAGSLCEDLARRLLEAP